MNCKFCNTENADDAVFCKHCGKRLDESLICPSCGTKCSDDALFCSACGAPLVPQNNLERRTKPSVSRPEGGVWAKVRAAFDLSGSICAIVAVFFALLFTFFIGATVNADISAASLNLNETNTIWEYFGPAYKDLAEILDAMPKYSGYYPVTFYLPIILGTVVSAATLICVVVFAIVASVKFAAHFKNPDNGYAKFVAAAVFSYVAGSVLIFGLQTVGLSAAGNEITVGMNGATVAGIILSCIFLGLYFACKIVTLGKQLVQRETVVNLVCTLTGIVFTILVLTFAAANALTISLTPDSSYLSSKISVNMNFASVNAMINTIYESAQNVGDGFEAAYFVNLFAQILQITLPVVGAALLAKRVGLFGEKERTHLGLSIALFVLAIVLLVVACVSATLTSDYIDSFVTNGGSSTLLYELKTAAGPIVALVFSALNLAAAVTHKTLNRTNSDPAATPGYAASYYGE